jgi:hypothetical protein
MKGPYVSGVMNGLRSVLVEMAKLQESECRTAWNNSILKNATSVCQDKNFQKCSALDADQVSCTYRSSWPTHGRVTKCSLPATNVLFSCFRNNTPT